MPTTTSLGGRLAELRAGGYVEVRTPARRWLGPLLSLDVTRVDTGEVAWSGEAALSSQVTARAATGEGAVPAVPFHDAVIRPPGPAVVRAWLRGFDRHTFLCGQSGSGRTDALGVLIERVLLETSLRIVILEPNSDYVRLGEVRSRVDPTLAVRCQAATSALRVHRADATGEERLRIRLGERGRRDRAAALQLDPIADRDVPATWAQRGAR